MKKTTLLTWIFLLNFFEGSVCLTTIWLRKLILDPATPLSCSPLDHWNVQLGFWKAPNWSYQGMKWLKVDAKNCSGKSIKFNHLLTTITAKTTDECSLCKPFPMVLSLNLHKRNTSGIILKKHKFVFHLPGCFASKTKFPVHQMIKSNGNSVLIDYESGTEKLQKPEKCRLNKTTLNNTVLSWFTGFFQNALWSKTQQSNKSFQEKEKEKINNFREAVASDCEPKLSLESFKDSKTKPSSKQYEKKELRTRLFLKGSFSVHGREPKTRSSKLHTLPKKDVLFSQNSLKNLSQLGGQSLLQPSNSFLPKTKTISSWPPTKFPSNSLFIMLSKPPTKSLSQPTTKIPSKPPTKSLSHSITNNLPPLQSSSQPPRSPTETSTKSTFTPPTKSLPQNSFTFTNSFELTSETELENSSSLPLTSSVLDTTKNQSIPSSETPSSQLITTSLKTPINTSLATDTIFILSTDLKTMTNKISTSSFSPSSQSSLFTELVQTSTTTDILSPNVTDSNISLIVNTSTIKNEMTTFLVHQTSQSFMEEDQDDFFWPLVLSLVIGIPAIIVFSIAMVVICKKRNIDSSSFFMGTSIVDEEV